MADGCGRRHRHSRTPGRSTGTGCFRGTPVAGRDPGLGARLRRSACCRVGRCRCGPDPGSAANPPLRGRGGASLRACARRRRGTDGRRARRRPGSCSRSAAKARISSDTVVANSSVCRSAGNASTRRLDVALEADVGQPVGGVDREELDAAEIDRALRDVIEQPSGGRDDDVDAVLEDLDLGRVVDAALDQHAAQLELLCVSAQRVFGARSELAGRHQEERAWRGSPRPAAAVSRRRCSTGKP